MPAKKLSQREVELIKKYYNKSLNKIPLAKKRNKTLDELKDENTILMARLATLLNEFETGQITIGK